MNFEGALLRWDIIITFLTGIALYIIIIWKRFLKNKDLVTKKALLEWWDFAFSIVTAATLYGGFSAICFAATGQLLFNENLIISQEFIILLAGAVLIGFGIQTYRNLLKKLKRRR